LQIHITSPSVRISDHNREELQSLRIPAYHDAIRKMEAHDLLSSMLLKQSQGTIQGHQQT